MVAEFRAKNDIGQTLFVKGDGQKIPSCFDKDEWDLISLAPSLALDIEQEVEINGYVCLRTQLPAGGRNIIGHMP